MQTILVVDDDDDIREGFAELLRNAGYDVYEAENGREALEKLAERDEPCLVLMDVMMPEMGGADLLDALERENRRDSVKVVALSAADCVHTVHKADRFLPKPVLPEQLLAEVGRHCEPCDPRSYVS
ncbi:MAG: response regulator [Polyangiales bacterium]